MAVKAADNPYGRQVIGLYRSIVHQSLRQSPMTVSSRRAFLAWQRRARATLRRILGSMPATRAPLRPRREVVETTDRYIKERVVYTTRPGVQVPAWLFTPRNVKLPAPAVLCLHGHSTGGKDECIDPKSIYNAFALRLAERGCVVLAPDQIGFGERKLPDGPVNYQVLTHGLNMLGHTLIGVRYYDLVRAIDLLETLPAVDKKRIGVMGLSLGGEMTAFLSALDPRVRAACVCGYITSHLHTFLDRPHCTCGHLRDLALHFEHADIAALTAPRPLFLDSGTADDSFPTADALANVRELRRIYTLFKKPKSHLGIEVHDGGHVIKCDKSIPWMLDRLNENAPARSNR
ncbi:MAG: alpha/beta hydrolase family protein [Planctomycetes bacterium]|nr:alpha/beta hydrolase family protein [Planctomycetota bacterium]